MYNANAKIKRVWRSVARNIFPVLIWSLLFVWALAFMVLLIWGIITSVKSSVGFYIDPVFFPKGKGMWAIKNYLVAFQNIKVQVSNTQTVGFVTMLINSLLFAVGNAFFSVLTAALASYIVAKYNRFRWVGGLWAIVLITNYMPLSTSIAANIKLLSDLGMYDSMVGNWLWSCGAFGAVFLMYYASWKGLSWGYAEAAFIDGAGHFRTMVQIMFPMTKTIFGVLFLMQFINLWNDYMTPIIALPSFPGLATGLYLYEQAMKNGMNYPMYFTGTIVTVIPVVVIFSCFQNVFLSNMSVGGIKG